MNKRISFNDLCIYIKDSKVLIFGDVHIGYEEALHRKGVLIPKRQLVMTIEKLNNILDKLEVNTIIINGDLKHEFGTILRSEWKEVSRLIDFLYTKCKKLILIEGNHDKILYPIAVKNKVKLRSYFISKEILVTHGDAIIKEADADKIKTIIIGHEHPAVTISDYPRIEKYKCFLVGKWKRKELIVMPSFNLLTEGTDVLNNKFLSPFINKIGEFHVYATDSKVLNFGKIKEIQKLH